MHQHITEYLNSYRNRENVDYAVMISGRWGSGKTYFVKDYLNGVGNAGKNYVYVSLNGVQTKQEIDFQIFQQVHPKLCGKGMLIGSRIIASIFRIGSASASAGSMGVEIDPSKIIGEISNALKAKTALLVLDDIERTVMPTDVFLGYVSEFLSCGVHVILVGAEDQFKKRTSSNCTAYKDVKEKVVGKTFEIPSAIEGIYDNVIGDLKVSEWLFSVLVELKHQIIADFKAVPNQCNYRALKAAIRELDFWLAYFPQVALNSDQFLKSFTQLFVALGYEQQLGNLTEENFGKCSSIIVNDNPKPTAFDTILERHGRFHDRWFGFDNYLLLSTDLFGRMLFSKAVSRDELASAILGLPLFRNTETQPAWERLWNFYEQEDEDIISDVKELRQELSVSKFIRPEEILMVFAVLANLAEARIIRESPDDIVKDARKYIQKVLRKGVLGVAEKEVVEILSRGYGGHGYPGEFDGKAWFSSIRKLLIEALANKRRKEFDTWFRDVAASVDDWEGDFYRRIRADDESSSEPIFNVMTPRRFFGGFLAMTNFHKREFGAWLQSRFSRMCREVIDKERDFWIGVSSLCDSCLAKRRSNQWRISEMQVGVLRNLITKTFALESEVVKFR